MAAYTELHCHSTFSLLDGASTPEELVAQAAALGMEALALTDHDAVYGAVRFQQAARQHGVRPLFGAELTLAGGSHLTLLVQDETGWRNLCALISLGRHHAPKGEAALPAEALAGHSEGLVALSGCRQGAVAAALARNDREAALQAARHLRHLFGPDRFWLELQHHLLLEDEPLNDRLLALAQYLGLGCLASNNVHYARQEGHRLQDVLVCIRHLTTLEESAHLRRPNSEFYLKPAAAMAQLFARYPGVVANTERVAARCQFELRYGLQDLPQFPLEEGMPAVAHLRHLCLQALPQRYPDPSQRVYQQLEHELQVIERAGLANYFLVVWDIVRFARENGIRCQGRGSAANSLVAYLLHISPVDPLAHDLVFERFLSDERQVVPDIDVDFDAARREEVIQYVYRRYGAEHTAMACTFVTFRRRSALRDVARALGVPGEVLAQAEEALNVAGSDVQTRERETSAPEEVPGVEMVLDLCRQLHGLPRHLGIHNGGMIITGPPLSQRVPSEPATMPGRVVVQWDKESLEEVGLVKIDLLGLRMLSALTEAEALLAAQGQPVTLDRLTFDDPAVYEMIGQADTIGVFQVESRAQAQMLPRLRPRAFADLVVAISLIRPGPIQGNMVRPYLNRRLGLQPVTYAHPLLEPALAETLGVILFQEQVLKVARDLAGFTPGQGEQLRRALGAKRATEAITRFHDVFVQGAQARGVPATVAGAVFEQLQAFGGYSFAKSHAAAFAVIVYQSAWLKRYHLPAFYAALLNNQPMGFWNPAVLVQEAKRQGVPLWPVDIRHSAAACTLEKGGIRLGLNYVKGMGEAAIERLLLARKQGKTGDLAQFCRHARLPRRLVERLIMAGAMDGWGVPRRRLLWQLAQLDYREAGLELVFPDGEVVLSPLSPVEQLQFEHQAMGLSPGQHVMALYRGWLGERGILGSKELARCRHKERVRVAGLLVVHQSPPTAKGFHFLTLEDEAGMINIIIRPQVYARYREAVRSQLLLLVEGVVQQAEGVTDLLASRLVGLRMPAL